MTDPAAPKWGVWRSIPNVEVWQAISLSFDFEPDFLEPALSRPRVLRGKFATDDFIPDGFDDRLRVTVANLGGSLEVISRDGNDRRLDKISLTAFAALADAQGWKLPAEFPRLDVALPARRTIGTATTAERETSVFDESHWTLMQLLAWVHTGDETLVSQASETNANRGTYSIEARGPSGRVIVEKAGGPVSTITVTMSAALDRGSSAPKLQDSMQKILEACRAGRLAVLGVAHRALYSESIPADAWAFLELCDDEQGNLCARYVDGPSKYEVRYRALRTKSADVLRIWPHPAPSCGESAELATQRKSLGRYRLSEAAIAIENATGERAEPMLFRLREAAWSGEIPIYEPGKNARYRYGENGASFVREYHDEAYWDDLNTWLKRTEPRIQWMFPNPNPLVNAVAHAGDCVDSSTSIIRSENLPAGATSTQLSKAFELNTAWKNKLSHVARHHSLSPALMRRGSRKAAGIRAGAALWNPVAFAKIYMSATGKNRYAIGKIIALNFSEWVAIWETEFVSGNEAD